MARKTNDTKRVFAVMLIATLAFALLFPETGWAGSRLSRGKASSGGMSSHQNRGSTSSRTVGRASRAPRRLKAGKARRSSSPSRTTRISEAPNRSFTFNRKAAAGTRKSIPRASGRNSSASTQRSPRFKESYRAAGTRTTVRIPRTKRINAKTTVNNRRGKTVSKSTGIGSPNRTKVTWEKTTESGHARISSRPLAKSNVKVSSRTGAGEKGIASRSGHASRNGKPYGNTDSGSTYSRSSDMYGVTKGDRLRNGPDSCANGNVVYGRGERLHRGGHHGCQRFGHYPSRVFYPVVWPSHYYPVYYGWGPYSTFRYIYPYYHRRYVFFSPGGYWPADYGYLRYYWYGCHPYDWYGHYPLAHRVGSDADSYYTYNTYDYYSDEDYESSGANGEYPRAEETSPEETNPEESSHGIRAELTEEPAKEPDPETLADRYFEEGVEAFGTGDYQTAVVRFGDASLMEPDDMIVPFAHVQALLADQQYEKAAETLRSALKALPPDRTGIFFPRGLYTDDDALFGHIDRLETQSQENPQNADLQLLLGYQFLGVGEYGRAEEPLKKAGMDPVSKPSSGVMLSLLEKLEGP